MLRKLKGKNKSRVFINTTKLLYKYFFSLILGQSIILGISVFILNPVMPFFLDVVLKASDNSYITDKNIIRILLNPITIIMLILLVIIMGIFFLIEASYLITFYSLVEKGEKPKLLKVFILTIKHFIFLILNKNFIYIPLIWVVMLLTNIPFLLFAIKRVRVFRFVAAIMISKKIVWPLLFMVVILLVFKMLQHIFDFHYCLLDDKAHKNELKEKGTINIFIQMDHKRLFKSCFYFITWNIIIALLSYLLYIIAMAITGVFVIGIPEKSLVVATFLSINERMSIYLMMVVFLISTISNFALFTHLYYQYKTEHYGQTFRDNYVEDVPIHLDSFNKTIMICIMILSLANFYFLYDIIRNGSSFSYVNLDMMQITSHRGFSHDVPENTVPAIEKALEEQADYIEVDVRQTKDGELVLLHDDNLKRTAGLNKKIWNTEYAEVALLDAGIWMNDEFQGTKIPTLREVFELCKGKVNINLDLKHNANQVGFEQNVVDLIKEYEMEKQCVITSTSLSVLENVKTIDPDIKTGYIAYQIYQSYYDNENIDFFSLKSYFVTDNLMQEVHNVGKEVHVWTVNNKSELIRMKRLGVDNIITDNPAYAKEVLYQEESNKLIITLLKLMIEY
ncbi:MAG: glycerophosphoryl diester phosphodiesterase [Anaerocolumna sp.]|jgi:glycerophosphoryl diester phosphodiesterase|nr:glycerophosphoryl diester phosphodiesterase [Anaerocolumna sp.]